jgi:predicted Zn-dependent protease
MKRAWILAFALACLPASAQFGNLLKNLDPSKIIDTGKKLTEANKDFTQEEEVQLGAGITAGVLGGAPPLKDANVQRYVNRVGKWVALHSERPDLPWTFAVIEGETVNAFAMPGGYVVISAGLLARLHSEAELAGALAHEIAHVVRKHQLAAIQSSLTSGALADVGKDLASSEIARRGGGGVGGAVVTELKSRAAGIGIEALKNGVFLRPLDRGMEYEADGMAVVLAARAGYDPYGLVGVLQMLEGLRSDGSGIDIMSTHPAPTDRIAELERAMPRLDRYASQPQLEARFRQVIAPAR